MISLPLLLRVMQRLDFPHKLGLCERLFARGLAGNQDCWVRTAVGLPWRLDLANPTHRWIVHGYYEGGGFLKWVRRNVPDGGTVVDSGANIGQMALYFAKWLPHGRVLAFEPGKAASAWLESCLLPQPELPVALLKMGLSDRAGTALLANSVTDGTHGSQAAITSKGEEKIELVRLDSVLADRRIDEVSIWKLDVEGHEIPALQGALSLLRERRVKALYIELAGENGVRICEHLARFGYRPNGLDFWGRVEPFRGLTEHGNALFLPS